MEYSSVLETQGGLISRGALLPEHLDRPVPTPTKAHNADRLGEEGLQISGATRGGVTEVWQEIDSSHLGEFSEWALDDESDASKPAFVKRLEEKTAPARESEILYVFFAYTDAREMTTEDVRRYIELAKTFSHVIITPIQTTLIRALRGSLSDNDLPDGESLPGNVYRAYKDSLTKFCEETESADLPLMGVMPIFSDYRRMSDHVQLYEEDYDIHQICIDYQNCTPTKEEYLDSYKKLVGNLGTREVMENRLLYAINPRYYSEREEDFYSPEDFLLGAMGFDIIGDSHIAWGGSSSDGVTTVRLFDRERICYMDVELDQLDPEFPQSGFSARDFRDDENDPTWLQGIFNSEQLEFAFQDLQRAIYEERAFEFLRSKEGLVTDDLNEVRSVANAYIGGTEKPPYEYSTN